MKPLAYVSDEMYVAIAGVIAEWRSVSTGSVAILRSSPTGAFYAEVVPGSYDVTLARDGYGSKTVQVELTGGQPHQFRLLSSGITGYAWPKWAVAGQQVEYRIHSVEEYRLSLWRYGARKEFAQLVTWMDEHGPEA